MRWYFRTGRSRSVPTIGYHAARSNLASQVVRVATLISLNWCDTFVR
jgi:hypothetical protein